MADILARCRGVARRSPEAERHSAATHREHSATGAVATGAAVIGAAIGVVIIDSPVISSSSLAILVIRFSMGIPITATAMDTPTGMIITADTGTDTAIRDTATAIRDTDTAIRGTATAIRGTATAVVTAEGPRWGSYSAGWLGQDTITALLMESWDQKRDARFGRTNAATMTASTA